MSDSPAGRPTFDELPVIEGLGLRHAWEVAPGDELGTISLLTAERVVEAARLVITGTVFDLTIPLTLPDPPLYGRAPLQHEIFELNNNDRDERLDSFFPQGSSQWDGLRHVRCREFGFYGGVTEEFSPGPGRLGLEHWVRHGIVGRGVLVDVGRYFASRDDGLDVHAARSITASDLQATLAWQGVDLREGDVLCVRFGWMDEYLDMSPERRAEIATTMAFPGLAADEAMSRCLWDAGLAAVVCDNPAVEVSPGDPEVGSLHRRLIPLLGFALGELFHFGELAEAAAQDRRYEFLFVSVPLNVPGAVGSPANAIAVR